MQNDEFVNGHRSSGTPAGIQYSVVQIKLLVIAIQKDKTLLNFILVIINMYEIHLPYVHHHKKPFVTDTIPS